MDAVDGGVEEKVCCAVCRLTAESLHLNYGVNTCFSCRAFFRRHVQHDITDSLTCKTGGQCMSGRAWEGDMLDDAVRKRARRCRKCRFEACFR